MPIGAAPELRTCVWYPFRWSADESAVLEENGFYGL